MSDKHSSSNSVSRRNFLLGAGAGALGVAAASCAPAGGGSGASGQDTEARLDRVLRNGVLRVGADLTFPPLQFRDAATNEPKGLCPEIDEQMAKDLGVDLEYVEMPFGELIAGLLADQFDWIGIAHTSTPARAQQVLFVDEPTFFEDSYLILKKGFKFDRLTDLNDSGVTFSNMSGSAQDASARLMFPNATFKPLEHPATLLEVAAGKSDVCLIALWDAAPYLHENPGTVDIWEGGSLFSDVNTYFVPSGDQRTVEWMGTWYRYYAAHQWIQARLDHWMAEVPGVSAIQEATSR